MEALITVLPGDGIGPEVATAGQDVLGRIADVFGHQFEFDQQLIGGIAIDTAGDPLPNDTLASCRDADAVLLGAVGGPKWSDPKAPLRPEQGLLALRSALGVFANIRPVKVHPALLGASPLKPEYLTGVNLVVVRELTGGVYFGEKKRADDFASDLCIYTRDEIDRVVRVAADLATKRRGKLCSVDKANVLETSRLWRAVTDQILQDDYPTLDVETLLVDAAAMHLLSRPSAFDVIVTENMFGDILTDEASMLAGSLGLLPSASVGHGRCGLYEPIHGSAPDIAGQNIANPIGTISSVAMLLRMSLGLDEEADAVEQAIDRTLDRGARTADIAAPDSRAVDTKSMTEIILSEIG